MLTRFMFKFDIKLIVDIDSKSFFPFSRLFVFWIALITITIMRLLRVVTADREPSFPVGSEACDQEAIIRIYYRYCFLILISE